MNCLHWGIDLCRRGAGVYGTLRYFVDAALGSRTGFRRQERADHSAGLTVIRTGIWERAGAFPVHPASITCALGVAEEPESPGLRYRLYGLGS